MVITIVGANDLADISVGTEQGDTDRGTVTEDGDSDDKVDTVQSVSGKLDIIDADKGEAVFQVQSNVEDGNYGHFSIDANGNWSYTLNNAHPDVQSLKAGETLTRELTVTSADGSDSHKVVITIVGANEAPVAQDFMIKPGSDHGVLINFNNPNGDGGDKISDEEDDAASSGNAALKVIITDLPEAGILIYTDLNGVSRAITQADVSKTPFEADRISYQPTDGLGFLLGSKSEPDHSLKDGGFLNWGNQIDAEGKVREVTFANGDVITISSDSGPLKQYQEEATHVGHGIGDNDGSGIEEGERISINFVSEPAHDIKVGLDGLGGLFESGDSGAALITVTYSNQTSVTFYVRKDSGVIGDDGLFKEWSHTAPGNLTITQLTFSTEGDGNWELRYVESLPKDETFKYQTIDSEGLLSNEATITVNNSQANRTPASEGGHIVTNEDQSYVFKWSDFGVTDVDTLPSSLSVIIDSVPLDGSLTLNGTAIVAGTSVSYEDINAGKLVFTPDTHESSTNNASEDGANVGNKESDYAKFDFKVSDGVSISQRESMVIDVMPVADGVVLKVELVSGGFVPGQVKVEQILTDLEGMSPSSTATQSDDYLISSNGAWVFSGAGNDVIKYGSGTDFQANGESGNDILIGGASVNDHLIGGSGNDILIGGKNAASSIKLQGDDGEDILISQSIIASTAYYGGEGNDVAYIPGSINDFELVTTGLPNTCDYRLVYTGTNTNHDFYSIETLYLSDGKYEFKDGRLDKVADLATLKIDVDLIDTDGSERFTDVTITGLPHGASVSGGELQSDGSWKVPASMLSNSGGNLTLQVELPVGSHNVKVTVIAGSQEYDASGQPIADQVKYSEADTGVIIRQSDPNGDNTVEGGKGDDVLMGDIGGSVTTVVPGKSYNIALLVDTSGSMAGDQNKLVIDALKQFVTDLEGHDGKINIALIGFAGSAVLLDSVRDLTDEKLVELLAAIDKLPASGATNYEDAFIKANNWFSSDGADALPKEQNLTFFLTDGEPTTSNSSSNSGGSTQFADMYDALTAFEALSEKSTVNAIGIGNGISKQTLSFFDNTAASGESLQTVTRNLQDISVTDIGGRNDDGQATWALGQEFILADNNIAQLSFTIEEGANFGRGDKLYWRVEHFVDGSWSIHTHSDNDGGYAVDLLQPGTYRIAVYAYEDEAQNTAQVKVEDIQLKVVTAPVGNVEIVTQADELDAVLASGNTYIELDSVGGDTVIGNEGNDILFGDAINTDNLPWGINGNPEKPEGIVDGAGLKGLETFLELKYGSVPSELDIYKFIKDNHGLFDVDGDTRGGNDTLDGGLGDDILYGQGGNDILIGGLGDDILTGGEGADIFKFVDQGTGLRDGERDTITDFTAGKDKIDLSDLLHTDLDDSIESLLSRDEIGLAINGGHLELTISDGSSNQTVVIENGVSQYQSYITEGSITNMNAILNDLLKIHDN
ncbi:VCBS domain-containing protein [Vibrio vulnificus]|uniref:VCBS domain-containing protein n=1 Tax=Vibrio vulnificus TaxID=672 RepID=UPI0030EE3B00